MPIRTDEQAVRGINTEADEDVDLYPFIEAASALVDEVCAPVTKADQVTLYYDDTRLELIERWLAAHFTCMNDPRTIIEQADRVREQFENKVDLGLQLTRYGQQVLILDTAGGLAALNANNIKGKGKLKPKALWLGTPPS